MKNKKRTAALAVTAVIFANLLPAVSVHADEAVAISTVTDFKNFTEKCVYDEYSKNKKFVLQNDIDLSGAEISCAGVFCGTFEGGGHSITNVKISADGSNKGLFAVVSKEGQIKDLNVTGEVRVSEDNSTENRREELRQRASSILSRLDIKTSDDEQSSDTKGAGGIAGYNAGKIVNCSFGGKLTGQSQVGGIAGINAMTGVIDSCKNGAEINGDTEIGGLAGYNEGRVKLSKNTGKICPDPDEHTVNIGGITGNSKGAVVACTNEGAVGGASFGDNVGGISGKQSGEIRECVNEAEVNGRRSVGGICGRFEPYTDIELSYESAKAALDKEIDTFNDDVESARKRIVDLFDELTDGKGIINDILDRLGIEQGSTGDRLDRITDSSTSMMNSITDAVNSMSDKNISGSLKESLDSVKSFSDETKTSVKDMSDSLDTSLNELNDFLNEFDGKGKEISDTLDNLNDALDKGEGDVDEIKDKLFSQMDELESDIDDAQTKLSSTNTTVRNAMRNVGNTAGDISDVIDDVDDSVTKTQRELQNIKNTIEALRKSVKDRIDEVKESIPPIPSPNIDLQSDSGYNVDPDASLDSGYEVEPSIVGAVIDKLSVTAYAAKDDDDDDKKTLFGDLLSTDTVMPRLIGDENADTALVKYCINNGSVTGNELSGGIAGSMGFESAVRSGESITLSNGVRVDPDAVLKAVLEDCVSYGDVKAKTSYAGGAVGKCDIGNIRNTLTTGEIETEEGGYAGGTAGMCSGDIDNCIAINDVSGKSYIGGIAGSAKNIRESYALPRLDGTTEYSGAIAGFASGNIEATYFIDEGLSGINGANLEGKAEAVKPSDIAVSDGKIPEKMPLLTDDDYYMADGDLYMPQLKALAKNDATEIAALLQSKSAEMAKFRFNVTFLDKGKELKSFVVDYGMVIAKSDIPRLSADGGEVPMWDKNTDEPIIRHTKFTAEYNKAATTLSSGEEPPLILVESIFDDGTELSVRNEEVEHKFGGYKLGEAYSFTLSKNAYDTIKVHVRDNKKKAAKIAVKENGKWTLVDCNIDGSYAVFEVGAPCEFAVLYKKGSYALPALAMLGILAILAAAAFVIIRRIKHGNKEEKNV